MPLLLIPVLIAAMLFGAYRLYAEVANQFCVVAGVSAVTLVVLILIGCVIGLVARHRYFHGKRQAGQRLLSIAGTWGELTLNADEKQGRLMLDQQEAQFIFADIEAVSHADGKNASVALQLRHAAQTQWCIPMPNSRQARRWSRILSLAASQQL